MPVTGLIILIIVASVLIAVMYFGWKPDERMRRFERAKRGLPPSRERHQRVDCRENGDRRES